MKITKQWVIVFVISVLGHSILFFGSWALFGFGIFLFVPIIFGMTDVAFSAARG